ncbi:phage minor head protein [Actinomadura sp. K4S16]|uniref:phage minor head protein n=1 Tax=Actinomadura sp. K4S16 TaxID=1316147 RepID=UPI0011F03992|nr:phage minor head protein [Actinomadura sp. K4S16]
MTIPPLPPARPPSALHLRVPTRILDRLETATEQHLTDTITTARTPADLRNTTGTVTATITRAAQAAHRIGALIARTITPPPRDPELPNLIPDSPSPADTLRLLQDLAIPDAVTRLLDDAATRLEQTTAPAREHLERTARRVWGYALTTIHTASNRGATWYARAAGYDLRWHTREDERVCPVCSPLNGRTATPATAFTLPAGTRTWPGFTGLPPAHPRCRCSVTPVRPAPRPRTPSTTHGTTRPPGRRALLDLLRRRRRPATA